MCGINGILRLDERSPEIDRGELLRTREAMASRGPDGTGLWASEDGRVALAHRRLAILDLTAAGAQPMASADGRVRIVVNGEIYNFRELRRELAGEGVAFRSESDTEVLLALYARDGLAMLPRLRGMYAFALWDDAEGRLVLARDPLGIKPLYYSAEGGVFRFASQVKALLAGGGISTAVDPAGLAGFLLWGSVPEPWTIRRGVRALPAGHCLVVESGRVGEPRPHYRFGELPAPPAPDPGAAVESSVRAHLVSDVPVAIFLSAGLDSGLIAALARRHLPEPPVTFTLSFDVLAGTPLDEAPLAAATARSLGTRHLERRVGRGDFPALWEQGLAAMDQPSIDGFNTFVVSRVAHDCGLKVVLSGLGGDEIFGSYPSFTQVPRWARLARWGGRVPGLAAAWPGLARTLARDRRKLPALLARGRSLAGAYFLRRGLFLPEELPALLGRERAAEGLAAYDPERDAAAALGEAAALGGAGAAGGVGAPGGMGAPKGVGAPGVWAPGGDGDRAGEDRARRNGHSRSADPWLAVHLMESRQYLRNQLLRDADWAGMAHSLEIRVPLVDAWLREQLARLHFAPARTGSKAEAVRRIAPELPPALFRRPKSGFYIPVPEWLEPPRRGSAPQRRGEGSRRLARRVLGEFGVDLHG
jgi:asparagine synthase (glutamine-hydrolysing)